VAAAMAGEMGAGLEKEGGSRVKMLLSYVDKLPTGSVSIPAYASPPLNSEFLICVHSVRNKSDSRYISENDGFTLISFVPRIQERGWIVLWIGPRRNKLPGAQGSSWWQQEACRQL
jgi:hypothetical protein